MALPKYYAEASLYEQSEQYYCTTYRVTPSTSRVVPAILRDPSSSYGGPTFGFFDRCDLGCWLRCVYIGKNEKLICDLACGC